MSLFQRQFYGQDPTFTNLFKMLDDFDQYSRAAQGPGQTNGRQRVRAFNPKFDVRETENSYELHGELPGIARDNVHIEFTEPQTLVVRGRVERNYSSGTPPAASLEDAPNNEALTEGSETNSHKATVTDEADEATKESGETTTEPAGEVTKKEAAPRSSERYWHQERSIGEFHRTFNFPGRVDESGVTASLENGILSVSIPKAAKHESHRISIN